jgi:hypothetical protein
MSERVSFGGVEEFDEEEAGSAGGNSYQSVSEYEGDLVDIPKTMFFGPELCRARFQMKSTGSLYHICGNQAVSCRRPNHRMLRDANLLGSQGFYTTVRVGKTIDGDWDTHCSVSDMEAREAERRARNIASLGTMLGMDGIELAVSSGETSEWTDGGTGAPTNLTGGYATIRQPSLVPVDQASRHNTEEAPDTEDRSEAVAREVERRVRMEREAVQAQMEFLSDQLRALDASMESPPAAESVPRTAPLPAARTRPVGPAQSLPGPRTRPMPPAPTATPAANSTTPAAVPKRYFVAIGPGGRSGIRETWQSAVALVGVDSTILEYPDLDSATEALWQWRQRQERIQNQMTGAEGAAVPGAMASFGASLGTGPLGSVTPVLGSPDTVGSAVPGPGDAGYQPPVTLVGPDPDKDSDQFYGLEIGSEVELRRAMAPADVDDEVAKDLAAAMLDSVAVPGTSSNSTGGLDVGDTEMGNMGLAIKDMIDEVTRERLGRERVRTDSGWSQTNRTALSSMKNATTLQARYVLLGNLRDKLMKTYVKRTVGIYTTAGWTKARAEAWAMGGYHSKIVFASYMSNLALYGYLAGLSYTVNWTYVQRAIDFHSEKLKLIRRFAESRLQALCEIYVYLRTGNATNWRSTELDSDRMRELCLSTTPQGPLVAAGKGVDRNPCAKCKSLVHFGGKPKCPWKSLNDEQAVAAAVKIMKEAGAVGAVEE